MRCTKCHKNEATIHFTPVVSGRARKTVHLCNDCAPARTRPHSLDPKKLEPLSVKDKRCDFCGGRARFGSIVAGEAVYTCTACATELRDIILDLDISGRPHLMERIKGTVTLISRDTPEVRAWLKAASGKATEILRARQRQGGRDKGS